MPKNPKTVAEINAAFENEEIMKSYGTALNTAKTYKFFSGGFETQKHSFCVFSSEGTIELIEQNIPPADRHILLDATFQICPVGPFKQILILYIRKYRQVCATHVFHFQCPISFDLFIFSSFYLFLSSSFLSVGLSIRICTDVSQNHGML